MQTTPGDTALDIAQLSLDETGEALLTRNFDLFARHYTTPFTISTEAGMQLRPTMAELRTGFEAASDHYASLGVDRLVRNVDVAVFDGPDRLRFVHVSHLYAGDDLVRPPYPNFTVMERRGDGWKTVSTQHVVADAGAHGKALLAIGQSDEPTAQDREQTLWEFQTTLDRMTHAYLDGDFDALCDTVQFPLFMQGSRINQVIADRDALRQDFDRCMTEFKVHGLTDIVRLVKSAEAVGTRRMHGTYRTHILRKTELLIPSYTSAMTLEQGDDGQWRVTAVMHPMGHLTLDRITGSDLSASRTKV
ncbi:hypothetical protein [Tropicibacter naphthalenivorans]|uniref:SnoaL-like domain protein n=1 Tax=Tropicibacter naphthalenivorans TaxID=441103 RepID=A0A0P1GGX5_9RHOB|nr:hypothetical protein [Tropicibacter naphthalenivorans]CUH80904.1 hypothetical protein TRN7648_03224 [Tropicibacter naphthalenivorans]SMC90967.1 hypothetical protein SAMN04488093_106196 [Tropicibacter naphthalenivorans]